MSIAPILKNAALVGGGLMGKVILDKTLDKAVEGSASSLLNAVGMIKQQWANGAGKSLVSHSKALRVEPHCLIDERISRMPDAKKFVQAAQRIFTPYYLLSVAADNKIGSVKVAQRLDKFATDRDLHNASVHFLSQEGFEHGLPFVGEAVGLDRYKAYSSEADIPTDRAKVTGSSVGDVNKAATEINNLSVGQVVNVELIDGQNRMTLPVQVRMKPMGATSNNIAEILALGGEDNSNATRKMRVRVGDLELIRDGILNQDRIDRYRAAVATDKTGYYQKMFKRRNRNAFATLLSGQPSIGELSTVVIMSRETQILAEEKMMGTLTDFETRQRIFDAGLMMLIMVVDDDTEVVTVYTRDIDDVAKYTFKDLEGAKSSNDMTDLLKLLMQGQMPGRL